MPEPIQIDATYVTEDGTTEYETEDGSESYGSEDTPDYQGGILYRLHSSVGVVQSQFWDDAISTLDCAIADNLNFTIEDARAWYRSLGIFDSGSVPLADMMQAINQKLNYPGDVIYGRSERSFIESQLRNAGFDVRVYENIFPDGMGGWETRSPGTVLGVTIGEAIYNDVAYGEAQYGENWSMAGISLCVNYLEESKDSLFVVGANYRSTFYVAGATITTFANIAAGRKDEFRQLLLQVKPTQTVGFLFVNYV